MGAVAKSIDFVAVPRFWAQYMAFSTRRKRSRMALLKLYAAAASITLMLSPDFVTFLYQKSDEVRK